MKKTPADVWHFQYLEYQTTSLDWKVPIHFRPVRPCAVYERNKWKTHHRATTNIDRVNCEKCLTLPEYQRELKNRTMAELNDIEL